MATFQELAKRYAKRIRLGTRKEGKKIASLTESHVKQSPTAQALKDVAMDINDLTYTGNSQPLNNDDRQKLSELISEELNFSDPDKLHMMLKEASIENWHNLTSLLSQFFAELDV